jgi:uncharacterized membrane protein YgdD (TMEM256/DUF423 family)
MKINKGIFLAGTLMGGLGVVFGAFGAHALNPILAEHGRVETYDLAVRYQFYHAFALMILGALATPKNRFRFAAQLLGAGTIIFSGSLYALSLSGATWWGAITPIGGAFMIAGWAVLFWLAYKSDQP